MVARQLLFSSLTLAEARLLVLYGITYFRTMKQLLLLIVLGPCCPWIMGQCNCKDLDQGNGTYYRVCEPVITGTDSVNTLEIGFSKLEQSTFLHMTVVRKGTPGIVNSMLTIHCLDGTMFGNVMVQRDTSSVDGSGYGSALFVLEGTPMAIEACGIRAVSFKLGDTNVKCPVYFTIGSVASQAACLP